MDRNLRGRVCVRGGRGGQRRQRTVISDEIRATVIDHVLVHGMSMREGWTKGTTKHQKIHCVHHNPKI